MIDDDAVADRNQVKRVIFCSGKIYYELLEAKEKSSRKDLALVRAEQLYPFPQERWTEILAGYPKAGEIVWCQEGPQNMEGWSFIHHFVPPLLRKEQNLIYVGRARQASPADSFLHTHLREQTRIVGEAIGS